MLCHKQPFVLPDREKILAKYWQLMSQDYDSALSTLFLGRRRVANGLCVLYSQTIVKFGIMALLFRVLKHMSGNLG